MLLLWHRLAEVMDYPTITICARCGRQRWSGPAPICALCQVEDERRAKEKVADVERSK